jgi:hypothetical protein
LTILTIPSLFAGMSHLVELLAVSGFVLNKDAAFAELAAQISTYRTLSGLLSVSILGVTTALTIGFGLVFIGRDKRQVVDKKKN